MQEDELTPKRRQEDVEEDAPQMSDTRAREDDDGNQVGGGGGEAAQLRVGPQRQEDVPDGVPQRSDTPTGSAEIIGAGDAVEQALRRESSFAKEGRGDWSKESADPLEIEGADVAGPDRRVPGGVRGALRGAPAV